MSHEPRLLTIPVVCRETTLSRSTVYRLILSGELASIKVGRSRRVPVTALDALIARLQAEAATAA